MKTSFNTYDEFNEAYPSSLAFESGPVKIRLETEVDWDTEGEPTKIIGYRFELPHQCDAWEIGNVNDAEEMVSNLKKAIEWLKINPLSLQ